jgi:hypothetical protein
MPFEGIDLSFSMDGFDGEGTVDPSLICAHGSDNVQGGVIGLTDALNNLRKTLHVLRCHL